MKANAQVRVFCSSKSVARNVLREINGVRLSFPWSHKLLPAKGPNRTRHGAVWLVAEFGSDGDALGAEAAAASVVVGAAERDDITRTRSEVRQRARALMARVLRDRLEDTDLQDGVMEAYLDEAGQDDHLCGSEDGMTSGDFALAAAELDLLFGKLVQYLEDIT